MVVMQSRRNFGATLTLAGGAALLGGAPAHADDGPPETTKLKLPHDPSICLAPIYVARDLLLAEGFTEVSYLPPPAYSPDSSVVRGDVDFDLLTAPWILSQLDVGEPLTVIGGIHAGCWQLFANEPIDNVVDLRGRKVGVSRLGDANYLQLALTAAYVGLDPHDDIDWVMSPSGNFVELLAEREIDAFLAFPPEPQDMRARRIGRKILDIGMDKPWSQYFCCMAVGNQAFVRDHPNATKRFLRATLRAASICGSDPERAARRLVEGGFTPRLDWARETLTDLPYAQWREYDAVDSLRFYALRLHEVAMLLTSPRDLIADGADWRFLNEIKRELKT